jgi:hypothetical protein
MSNQFYAFCLYRNDLFSFCGNIPPYTRRLQILNRFFYCRALKSRVLNGCRSFIYFFEVKNIFEKNLVRLLSQFSLSCSRDGSAFQIW